MVWCGSVAQPTYPAPSPASGLQPKSTAKEPSMKGTIFMKGTILASTVLIAAFATEATAAEFYVIQDSSTKRCTVVDKKPTVKTETIVGNNGKTYTTRDEAMTAMKSEKICEETH
jgi:hypothetical protein